MLTKKKLRRWINVAAIAFVLGVTVAGWLIPSLSVGEKAVGTLAVLTALRASLPSLKKEAQDAIDGADIPEDEPKPEEAAK